jgi:hypothetical protein
MSSFYVFAAALFFSTVAWGGVEKRCVKQGPFPYFLSTNADTQGDTTRFNKLMTDGEPAATAVNSSRAFFVPSEFGPGDCLMANTAETFEGTVVGQSKEIKFLPVVARKADDGARRFGLVEAEKFAALPEAPRKSRESSPEEILNYPSAPADILVLYVICPKDRDEVCELTIKDRGKWVKRPGSNAKVVFKVLARSERDPQFPNVSRRISTEGDTPQGIYYIWGTLFSPGTAFGGVPRLDLDAALPPVNGSAYEINSYLLSQLIPDSARDEYWANEWALAFKMGRTSMRIHGSSLDKSSPYFYTTPKTKESYLLTAGCISAGKAMPELIEVLVAHGLFSKSQAFDKSLPATRNWRVTSKIGRAFVIVKDKN